MKSSESNKLKLQISFLKTKHFLVQILKPLLHVFIYQFMY